MLSKVGHDGMGVLTNAVDQTVDKQCLRNLLLPEQSPVGQVWPHDYGL